MCILPWEEYFFPVSGQGSGKGEVEPPKREIDAPPPLLVSHGGGKSGGGMLGSFGIWYK